MPTRRSGCERLTASGRGRETSAIKRRCIVAERECVRTQFDSVEGADRLAGRREARFAATLGRLRLRGTMCRYAGGCKGADRRLTAGG